jgi:TorA maturation chaperone TorD
MEKTEIARGRSSVYKLLSRVFIKEISPEFLETLRGKEISESLKELGVDIGRCLACESEDKLLDDLATEYAALFLTPGGLSPHESVRLKGLLMQEPASKVLAFYKECGLEIPKEYRGFPDQLGVEFEFMGYLADEECKAWQENKAEKGRELEKLQARFMREHLSKWVVGFCKEVEEVAFHPFYKEMVGLTRRFIESEIEELIGTVEETGEEETEDESYGCGSYGAG